MGRDSSSEVGGADANEFGILFADNTDRIRLANVLIANFRNGCYEADSAADLSGIDTNIPGPTYLDGVHCTNEAGANPDFGMVRAGSTGFPPGTVAANNSNGDGLVYYNGAGGELVDSGLFNPASGGINFTGELVERGNHFTAGWYLDNIRGIGNGLLADPDFLNGFLDGDTNNNGVLESGIDDRSPFIIADDGPGDFNQNVAEDTGGYDMTHVGSVRGGAPTNIRFDNWTVDTLRSAPFTVRTTP